MRFLREAAANFETAAIQADKAVSQSSEVVAGGIKLSSRRTRKAVGLVRHQFADEFFERLISEHGGELVGSVPVDMGDGEPRNAPIHLTTGRFGRVLLGFASHRERDDLPVRRASRIALASQNRGLSLDLLARGERFGDRDRFVIIMVRRDPVEIDKVAEMTICVTDPALQFFLMQTRLDEFLAGYGTRKDQDPARGVQLKMPKRRFKDIPGREGTGTGDA